MSSVSESVPTESGLAFPILTARNVSTMMFKPIRNFVDMLFITFSLIIFFRGDRRPIAKDYLPKAGGISAAEQK